MMDSLEIMAACDLEIKRYEKLNAVNEGTIGSLYLGCTSFKYQNQSRTNGPINAHLTIAQV